MKIVIGGGTGLIGSELVSRLVSQNHEVKVLTTRKDAKSLDGTKSVYWNPKHLEVDYSEFNGYEIFINLAGSSIAQRWTEASKKSIIESRTQTNKLISNLALNNKETCQLLLTAGGIGIYEHGDFLSYENSAYGNDFVADVCKKWESSSEKVLEDNIRRVVLRIGVVLAKEGGFLKKMEPVYKMGLGSPIGSGKQWQSWVHIEDVVCSILHFIEHRELGGIYNCTSPNPVQNKEMSKSLAKALNRPHFFPPVPKFALKLILGEMAKITYDSLNVSSKKLQETGYIFKHPHLKSALDSIYQD